MELINLIGKRKFSGIEHGSEKDQYNDDRDYVIFELDGIQYVASEDPDDGYRSYCEDIEIVENKIKNKFKPIDVFCKMRVDKYEECDVLELWDIETGKLIMAIGTSNTDDYYPYFTFEYHPEDMVTNA